MRSKHSFRRNSCKRRFAVGSGSRSGATLILVISVPFGIAHPNGAESLQELIRINDLDVDLTRVSGQMQHVCGPPRAIALVFAVP
jgi:hypothetical protein